jgi:IMP cyclohydrolase
VRSHLAEGTPKEGFLKDPRINKRTGSQTNNDRAVVEEHYSVDTSARPDLAYSCLRVADEGIVKVAAAYVTSSSPLDVQILEIYRAGFLDCINSKTTTRDHLNAARIAAWLENVVVVDIRPVRK